MGSDQEKQQFGSIKHGTGFAVLHRHKVGKYRWFTLPPQSVNTAEYQGTAARVDRVTLFLRKVLRAHSHFPGTLYKLLILLSRQQIDPEIISLQIKDLELRPGKWECARFFYYQIFPSSLLKINDPV